ncbi:putative alpha-1,2-mannosidase [Streptomyces sp. Tu6071]|nr:putative alpha-1,2-mannosidase [Streptomyces sp. Tu6071]
MPGAGEPGRLRPSDNVVMVRHGDRIPLVANGGGAGTRILGAPRGKSPRPVPPCPGTMRLGRASPKPPNPANTTPTRRSVSVVVALTGSRRPRFPGPGTYPRPRGKVWRG